MFRTAISLAALAAPATALAQTAPIPISQENWVSSADLRCSSDDCGAGGSVGFLVTVATTGRVANCVILQSSGDPQLDQQTCRILTIRARFEPAKDANGNPVEGRYVSQMRWSIP